MSKPVLFVSFRNFDRAENIQAIYHAYPGEKDFICTQDPAYRSTVLSGKYHVMIIDEFPTISPGVCISIGHGIHGGKYVGLDQPDSPFYNIAYADVMTYIISAGTGAVPLWQQSTGVPADRILTLGIPRADQYVGRHKGDGHTPLAKKRSYLFVPTLRDRIDTGFPEIDWDYIDNHLTDAELFAVKAHPNTRTFNVGPRRHIIEITGDEVSAPYLIDADVVITDYSSIMFDAYLLGKPVVLFEKVRGYTHTRGMYLRYPDEYCSKYARTEDQMLYLARYSDGHLGDTELGVLHRLANRSLDGHACERLVNLINKLNRPEGGDS